ncbi:hypothetical protein MG293_003600 [Ovis ammon polii]|uniref:Uncharacterized protein n=1 Tax=Ovis ammon polii TaxID=230172 RepID=A0AAD4YDK2_OVIAM|nr:hypothetical protein MG293_003600 [Ovis ammon polii]
MTGLEHSDGEFATMSDFRPTESLFFTILMSVDIALVTEYLSFYFDNTSVVNVQATLFLPPGVFTWIHTFSVSPTHIQYIDARKTSTLLTATRNFICAFILAKRFAIYWNSKDEMKSKIVSSLTMVMLLMESGNLIDLMPFCCRFTVGKQVDEERWMRFPRVYYSSAEQL